MLGASLTPSHELPSGVGKIEYLLESVVISDYSKTIPFEVRSLEK